MRLFGVQIALVVVASCGSKDPPRTTTTPPSVVPTTQLDRYVVFANAPLVVPANGTGPVSISPALPAGLSLDVATGAITGTPKGPSAATYRLHDTKTDRAISIAVIAPPTESDRFVALTGDDKAAGTLAAPFRTVRRALTSITPGTTVFIRTGVYAEDVVLHDVHGTTERPIIVRAYPGDRVMLGGEQASVTWKRAEGADEWISNEVFEHTGPESTSRGAFAEREPYTRLLTYSRVEDLRAANQKWEIGSKSAPGTTAVDGKHMPWTYFGPGLWHDPADGKVHLRLSATENRITGITDYAGPADPAKVPIQIWARSSTPLLIQRSSDVEVRDLTVRGGGDETVRVDGAERVLFDHVSIDAASVGLVVKQSKHVTFTHSKIDGGIPPWSFRSDFKAAYKFTDADGAKAENGLVRKTSRGLMYVGEGVHNLEFSYCELLNGHDIYFGGIDAELHHCRIRNIHDEGLFISHLKDISNLRIHDNVFERVLSAISGIGKKESGPRYLYRNIFDLRDPTQAYRPGASRAESVWRRGGVFKGAVGSAPFFFYQNTVLVQPEKAGQPALLHYRNLADDSFATWFLNNVVVIIGDEPAPFAFHPDASFADAVDRNGRKLVYSEGNAYIRHDGGRQPAFTCVARGKKCATRNWTDLGGLRAVGREKRSKLASRPGFAHLAHGDRSTPGDNMRPSSDSPARGIAVELPPELPDSIAAAKRHDAGAFESDADPLYVGVDGRFVY